MQRHLPRMLRKIPVILFLVIGLLPASVPAKPTSPEQAQRVVAGWLARDGKPLGAILGQEVREVQAFRDEQERTAYFIVYLAPAGFIVVPADDLVEPIIAFVPRGLYNPSLDNPLGALVTRDVPQRVRSVRAAADQALMEGVPFLPRQSQEQARQKWQTLENQGLIRGLPENQGLGIGPPSDPRVDPLLKSKWDQMEVEGNYCYNYYTPNHYPCGCVATAVAQVMRYFQFPKVGVGTTKFEIKVNGVAQQEALRGGNGLGGPYDWGNMVLVPDEYSTDIQLRAIGALTHDAGVAVNMAYTAKGSDANLANEGPALVNTFKYGNAIVAETPDDNIPIGSLIPMINPSLDASLPVLLGMHKTGSTEGHAIVADGYGYNLSTLYHHLNMGWSGGADAWYNLPNVDSPSPYPSYDIVDDCIYNIYTSGKGEIISGRVLDAQGKPISGAAVEASKIGVGTYSATTNSRGIYALAKVPSASTYTMQVSKAGYRFKPRIVTTGTSAHGDQPTGNRWGVNFAPAIDATPAVNLLLLN